MIGRQMAHGDTTKVTPNPLHETATGRPLRIAMHTAEMANTVTPTNTNRAVTNASLITTPYFIAVMTFATASRTAVNKLKKCDVIFGIPKVT